MLRQIKGEPEMHGKRMTLGELTNSDVYCVENTLEVDVDELEVGRRELAGDGIEGCTTKERIFSFGVGEDLRKKDKKR